MLSISCQHNKPEMIRSPRQQRVRWLILTEDSSEISKPCMKFASSCSPLPRHSHHKTAGQSEERDPETCNPTSSDQASFEGRSLQKKDTCSTRAKKGLVKTATHHPCNNQSPRKRKHPKALVSGIRHEVLEMTYLCKSKPVPRSS